MKSQLSVILDPELYIDTANEMSTSKIGAIIAGGGVLLGAGAIAAFLIKTKKRKKLIERWKVDYASHYEKRDKLQNEIDRAVASGEGKNWNSLFKQITKLDLSLAERVMKDENSSTDDLRLARDIKKEAIRMLTELDKDKPKDF
jgi:hypothetical protein